MPTIDTTKIRQEILNQNPQLSIPEQDIKVSERFAELKKEAGTFFPPRTPVPMVDASGAIKEVNKKKDFIDRKYTPGQVNERGEVFSGGRFVRSEKQELDEVRKRTEQSFEEPKATFTNADGQEVEFTDRQLALPVNQEFLHKGGFVLQKSNFAVDGTSAIGGATQEERQLQSKVDALTDKYEGLVNDFDSYNVDQDPDFKVQADLIRSQYAKLRNNMEQLNKQRQNALVSLGFRTGAAQYAGAIQKGIEGEELTQANERMAELARQEASALSDARSAFENNEWSQFNKRAGFLKDLREMKSKELDKYNATLAAENKKIQDDKKFELDQLKTSLDIKKVQQDILTNNLDLYSSSLISFNEDGALQIPDETTLNQAAEELGVSPNILVGAVRNQYQSLQKLDEEAQQRQLNIMKTQKDLLNADLTNDIKEYEFAKKGGYIGTLLDFKGKKQADGVTGALGGYHSDILVARLGKQIYGTRISDKESERVQSFIEKGTSMGKSELEIIDDVLGFNVTKNKELAGTLRNNLLQIAEEDGLAGFDMLGLARLLNDNKMEEAIRRVELQVLNKAKQVDPDGYISESVTKTAVQRGKELEDYVLGLDKSPVGVIKGSFTKWIKRKFRGKEEQEVLTKVTQLVVEMRNRLLGSAVTPSESLFLEPLVPDLNDTPQNFMTKLQNLQTEPQRELNNFRGVFGLPELGSAVLRDQIGKVGIYEEMSQKKSLSGTFNNWYTELDPQTQAIVDGQFENPDFGDSPEEAMQKILELNNIQVDQGFSQPLSMGLNRSDVSGIKDFTKVATSIGNGTATGIVDGSKFWKYGYDLVLTGGKGAAVKTPTTGVVLSAGKDGNWGNSVRIKQPNGEIIRLSHLNDIRVKEGQQISSGTVVGGQGNTGKTYGPTGIHVDITVYKSDGKPYSSQEVAAMLNTKTIA